MGPKKKIKVEVENSHVYYINGVKVSFPVKAYPSQISIMNKILHGIDQKKNCLLESPTGSGKSLALLCSCLAWQKAERERIASIPMATENVVPIEVKVKKIENRLPNEDTVVDEQGTSTKLHVRNNKDTSKSSHQKSSEYNDNENDDGDDVDFEPVLKITRRNSFSHSRKKVKRKGSDTEDTSEVENPSDKEKEISWKMVNQNKIGEIEQTKNKKSNKSSQERIPKIYFGTRTHKQIAQIIRELRKTDYKDIKMSILGSREHLCIHPVVSKNKDKNDECKSLLKGFEGKSCRFHSNAHLFNGKHPKQKFNSDSAWDIEDLVTAGKKMKACPYYGSRDLVKGADIIFCPYNYLIDPLIRGQMLIDLKDEIVVLDEAHNIEDSAREAASVTLTMLQLEDTKANLREMIDLQIMTDSHRKMQTLCVGILNWIESVKDRLDSRGFENEAKVWTGKEMVRMLGDESTLRLSPYSLSFFKEELQKLISEEQEDFSTFDENAPRLNSKSLGCLVSVIFILEKLFDVENDFASDYRVGLLRSSTLRPVVVNLPGGWVKKSNKMEKVWTYKLNLWCLNPAVVFAEVGSLTRTIVLTSGTLSPMTSFSSELGVHFPISLEANHVIDDSQVWIGNIGVGPSNQVINANYKNSETFVFQDEVGNVVLQVCKVIHRIAKANALLNTNTIKKIHFSLWILWLPTGLTYSILDKQSVPKGVLCFLPSYSMMEKLMKRWKTTGLWERLTQCKVVQAEPRGTDKNEFDNTLQHFYECANMNYASGDSSLTGALLFAVCRGKVSEGLDFSDDNARAVIVIGIPFPNLKDVQVELKRKYNNSNVSRGLLNGNDWYEMQAFRALNQAVGRCIRHRNDWGAILMVDERFGRSPKYRDGLSKWVRGKFQRYNDFQVCIASLASFVQHQINPELSINKCSLEETKLFPSKESKGVIILEGMKNHCADESLNTSKVHVILGQDNITTKATESKFCTDTKFSEEKTNSEKANCESKIENDTMEKTKIPGKIDNVNETRSASKEELPTRVIINPSMKSPTSAKRFQWEKVPSSGKDKNGRTILNALSSRQTFINKFIKENDLQKETTTSISLKDKQSSCKVNTISAKLNMLSKNIVSAEGANEFLDRRGSTRNQPNALKSTGKHTSTLVDDTALDDIKFDEDSFEELKSSFSRTIITSNLNKTPNRTRNLNDSIKTSSDMEKECAGTTKFPDDVNIDNNLVKKHVKKDFLSKTPLPFNKYNNLPLKAKCPIDNHDKIQNNKLQSLGSIKTTTLPSLEFGENDDQSINDLDMLNALSNCSPSVAIEIDDNDLSLISTQILRTGSEKCDNFHKDKDCDLIEKKIPFKYPNKLTSTPKLDSNVTKADLVIINRQRNKSKSESSGFLDCERNAFRQSTPKRNQSKSLTFRMNQSNLTSSSNDPKCNPSNLQLIQLDFINSKKNDTAQVNQKMAIENSNLPSNISSKTKPTSKTKAKKHKEETNLYKKELEMSSHSMIATPPSPDLFDSSLLDSQSVFDCICEGELYQNQENNQRKNKKSHQNHMEDLNNECKLDSYSKTAHVKSQDDKFCELIVTKTNINHPDKYLEIETNKERTVNEQHNSLSPVLTTEMTTCRRSKRRKIDSNNHNNEGRNSKDKKCNMPNKGTKRDVKRNALKQLDNRSAHNERNGGIGEISQEAQVLAKIIIEEDLERKRNHKIKNKLSQNVGTSNNDRHDQEKQIDNKGSNDHSENDSERNEVTEVQTSHPERNQKTDEKTQNNNNDDGEYENSNKKRKRIEESKPNKQLGTRRPRRGSRVLRNSSKRNMGRTSTKNENSHSEDELNEQTFVELCSDLDDTTTTNNDKLKIKRSVKKQVSCIDCNTMLSEGSLLQHYLLPLDMTNSSQKVQVYNIERTSEEKFQSRRSKYQSGFFLNAYIDESKKTVYQMLYCKQCEQSQPTTNSPIGFQAFQMGKGEKNIYLFQDCTEAT